MNKYSMFERLYNKARKPEYLFQPLRIFNASPPVSADGFQTISLPWGSDIRLRSGHTISDAIVKHGIYELAVSEVLWRLLKSGNTFVDAGANIGYMSSLMAAKVGPMGRGYAFEPHPEIYASLHHNVAASGNVKLFENGLGSEEGILNLVEPVGFRENDGVAHFENLDPSDEGRRLPVVVVRLDSKLSPHEHVDVLKIDVEGAELQVMQGAEALLERKAIQHIIFEDFAGFPSPCVELLLNYKFTVLRISKGVLGPLVWNPAATNSRDLGLPWEPVNYIATLQPEMVSKLLAVRGWKVFSESRNYHRRNVS